MDNRDNPIIIDGRNGSQTFGRTQTRTASSLLAQVLVITSVGFFTSAVGVWLAPISAPAGMFWLVLHRHHRPDLCHPRCSQYPRARLRPLPRARRS